MKIGPLISAALVMTALSEAKTSPPDNWGVGMHFGGGEMVGFHGMRNSGRFQFRFRLGISMTYHIDGLSYFLAPDTLNTRSVDYIGGIACRGYLYKWVYSSVGLSFNDRRIETNIERIDNDTDLDISEHQTVWEAPLLFGTEFRRGKRISVFMEAGYVFQLTKGGSVVTMENPRYTAIYEHPTGSATVGVGMTYNFIGN